MTRELLEQAEPLDDFDRSRLIDWLRVLSEDVEMFGATPEDIALMQRIRAKLVEPKATP
jgi:hypothetical protein